MYFDPRNKSAVRVLAPYCGNGRGNQRQGQFRGALAVTLRFAAKLQ